MKSLAIKVIVKVILGYVKMLWDRFTLKEQGRREVREQINKATEKLKNEFEKIDNSGTTVESALDRLRNRANSNAGAANTNTGDR